ncbi:PilZ domain-containing protein [Treponema sp.]|uniref:PilZ domain-containing protein n=1 Tax=Treponema sp. TaxID=166 RepID=UPI0025D13B43|nr:PilZ domain-containing protein [Treponema sp.]MCR5217366.1 PilZ domain-containing protein [Treponema sp.]
MKKEHRTDERFDEVGRVTADGICAYPGMLDDISASGCKMHFPVNTLVDMEKDYNVKINLSHTGIVEQLELVVHPQWKKDESNETYIGFRILRSPDTPLLNEYIHHMKNSSSQAQMRNLLITTNVDFI